MELEEVKSDTPQSLEVVKNILPEMQAVTRRTTRVEEQLQGLSAAMKQLTDMVSTIATKGNFPVTQGNTQVQHELPCIKESSSYTGGSQESQGRSPLPLDLNSTQGTASGEENTDPQRTDSEPLITPSPSPVTERQMTNSELAEAWSRNTQSIIASVGRQKPALPTFSGDSRNEYSIFIRRFHSYLQDNAVPPSSKLDMLLNACTGKLRDLLSSFVQLGPKDGFDAAMKALSERLGSVEEHVDEAIWELQRGPPVKGDDIQELKSLTFQMWDCIIRLEIENRLPAFDNYSCVASIANRFTGKLKERYTEKSHEHKKENGTWPGIKWLLTLVDDHIERLEREVKDRQAKEAAGNATTDRLKEDSGSSSTKARQDQKTIQLATVGTSPGEAHGKKRKRDQTCYLCYGQHPIYACQQFRDMGVAERWAVVKRAQACYGCLGLKHTIKECKSPYKVCDVAGCCRTHSKWLHRVDNSKVHGAQEERDSEGSKPEEKGTIRVVSWANPESKRMKMDDSDS